MKRLKILLVDDNQAFLALSLKLLAPMDTVEVIGWGYNGFDGVRLAEELKPDLVIMDLEMPRMGGLQATRLIKAQHRPPMIAIASYHDDVERREHVAAAGADGFIGKSAFEKQIAAFLQKATKLLALPTTRQPVPGHSSGDKTS
jgi:DNA-binding NarL/FixJ family response regulator